MNIFKNGISEEIKPTVYEAQPKNLTDAVNLASEVEKDSEKSVMYFKSNTIFEEEEIIDIHTRRGVIMTAVIMITTIIQIAETEEIMEIKEIVEDIMVIIVDTMVTMVVDIVADITIVKIEAVIITVGIVADIIKIIMVISVIIIADKLTL